MKTSFDHFPARMDIGDRYDITVEHDAHDCDGPMSYQPTYYMGITFDDATRILGDLVCQHESFSREWNDEEKNSTFVFSTKTDEGFDRHMVTLHEVAVSVQPTQEHTATNDFGRNVEW